MSTVGEGEPVRGRGRLKRAGLALTILLLLTWGMSVLLEVGVSWLWGNSGIHLGLFSGIVHVQVDDWAPADVPKGFRGASIRRLDKSLLAATQFGLEAPGWQRFTREEMKIFRGSPAPRLVTVVTVPLWIPLLLVGPLTVRALLRARRGPLPGHCRKCGYDLRGNISGKCPECGTAVEEPAAKTA